jgi:UDP-glucose 4-epimerase
VLDVARHVLAASGSDAGVEFVPFERVYGEGFVDPPRRRPDVSRLRALVGWAPRRTLLHAVHDLLATVPARG